MKAIKKLRLLSVVALAGSMLMTGCNKKDEIMAVTEPAMVTEAQVVNYANTDELSDAWKENIDTIENFKLEGITKLVLAMTSAGEEEKMPIEISYSAKISKTMAGYLDAAISIDMPGEDDDVVSNIKGYFDYDKTNQLLDVYYQTSDEPNTWYHSSETADELTETNDAIDLSAMQDDFKFPASSTFMPIDQGYVVDISLQSIFDSDEWKTAIADMNSEMQAENPDMDLTTLLQSLGIDINDVYSQLGQTTISYSFDRKGMLNGLDITNLSYTLDLPLDVMYTNGESGSDTSISFAMTSLNTISDYNTLNSSDYTVPDDIKSGAVEEANSYVEFETGMNDMPYGDDVATSPIDDSYTVRPAGEDEFLY